jgi:putative oxidoreductase
MLAAAIQSLQRTALELHTSPGETKMKIVVLIARILLGLVFAFFGANLLFHFLPTPPMPPSPARDFMTVMAGTHYIHVVGFFQLVPGILLLINRYVPLALTVLAAEIVNILTTHVLVMGGVGLFPAPILVVILWIIVFWSVRPAFAGIFQARAPESLQGFSKISRGE